MDKNINNGGLEKLQMTGSKILESEEIDVTVDCYGNKLIGDDEYVITINHVRNDITIRPLEAELFRNKLMMGLLFKDVGIEKYVEMLDSTEFYNTLEEKTQNIEGVIEALVDVENYEIAQLMRDEWNKYLIMINDDES